MCGSITALWVLVMGLLALHEWGPRWRASTRGSLAAQRQRVLPQRDGCVEKEMGIYLGPKRIGQCTERWAADGDDLHISSRMVLDVMALAGLAPSLGVPVADQTSVIAVVEGQTEVRNGRVAQLTMAFRFGEEPPVTTIEGYVRHDTLLLRVRNGAHTDTRSVRIDPQCPLTLSSSPTGCLPDLYEGKSWRLTTLNPVTFKPEDARARVTRRERIEIEERSCDAFVVEVDYGTYRIVLWADEQGEILKQKVMGLTYIHEARSRQGVNPLLPVIP